MKKVIKENVIIKKELDELYKVLNKIVSAGSDAGLEKRAIGFWIGDTLATVGYKWFGKDLDFVDGISENLH